MGVIRMFVSYCACVPVLLFAALKAYSVFHFHFGLSVRQSQAIAVLAYLAVLFAVNALVWSVYGKKEAVPKYELAKDLPKSS